MKYEKNTKIVTPEIEEPLSHWYLTLFVVICAVFLAFIGLSIAIGSLSLIIFFVVTFVMSVLRMAFAYYETSTIQIIAASLRKIKIVALFRRVIAMWLS